VAEASVVSALRRPSLSLEPAREEAQLVVLLIPMVKICGHHDYVLEYGRKGRKTLGGEKWIRGADQLARVEKVGCYIAPLARSGCTKPLSICMSLHILLRLCKAKSRVKGGGGIKASGSSFERL